MHHRGRRHDHRRPRPRQSRPRNQQHLRRGDRPHEVAATISKVLPIIAFAVGLVILYYLFKVGWFSGPRTEDNSTLLLYLLGGLFVCVLYIIVWGVRSESNRHRKSWMALILAAVLLITLGAWWIVSLGLFIVVFGLVPLVYSSSKLAETFR